MSSANEKIADALRKHSIDLARYTESEKKMLFKRVDQLFRKLRAETTNANIFTGTVAQQRKVMNALFKQAEFEIFTSYEKISEYTAKSMRDLAEVEALWTSKQMSSKIGVKTGLIKNLTEHQLSTIASDVLIGGAPSSEWWSRQAEKLRNNFKDQIREGWSKGESLETLLKRLTGGKDENGNPIFDIRKGTLRGAEATIRSSFQTMANDVRMKVYKENEEVISGYQWQSTLDDRTTIMCAVRDGLVWDTEHNSIDHDIEYDEPPIHWNCRSQIVCVLKSYKELGIDREEYKDEGTRASMDGQVSAKKTFEEWIAGKPDSYADEAFGKGKADLWRDGKITVRDMVDQQGRPLTLEQLKETIK